jgi:hypothetical protein
VEPVVSIGGSQLTLNIVPVALSADSLRVGRLPYTDEDDYAALREEHWRARAFRFDARTGEILNVALEAGIAPLGVVEQAPLGEHLPLAAKAIQQKLLLWLAGRLPILKSSGRRLVFLGQVEQSRLLSKSLESAGLAPIERLEVSLRYELDCRVFVDPAGEPFLGLVVDVGTTNVIDIPVLELLGRGVSVLDRYVMQRREDNRDYMRPGLEPVGRVSEVRGTTLILSDASGADTAEAAEALLEPRTENLHAVVEALCGAQSAKVLASLKGRRGPVSSAKGKLAEIERTVERLHRQKFTIGDGVRIELGDLLRKGDGQFPGTIDTARPTLLFGAQGTNTHQIADTGVSTWGPYKYLQHERNSPLLAVVCEARHRGRVEQFLNSLCNGIPDQDWKSGSRNPFRTGLIGGFRLSRPKIEFEEVGGTSGREYRDAAERLLQRLPRTPDLAFVQITEASKRLPSREDPYLTTKAAFMASGVVTQALRIETIDAPQYGLAHILNGLACATYAKLDGTPWVVSTRGPVARELVVGIGMAETRQSRLGTAERYVGITTVFQGDGRYLVWGLTREVPYDDYPAALLESLRTAVRYVREQDDWEAGDTVRLVFHVYKSLKKREIEATKALVRELLADAFEVKFAFLDLSWFHPYLIFDPAQQGKTYRSGTGSRRRGQGLPARGTSLQLDEGRALLHLTGPDDIKTEEQGLPRPLLVEVHRDSDFADLTYLVRQVYHFTYASWRSPFPASEPVTIKYSRMIARLLGNLKSVPGWSSATVTTGALRGRMWFL